MGNEIRAKVITIATAGTPTQVDNNYTVVDRIEVSNPAYNTGRIYIGASDLAATTRYSIEVGKSFILFRVDITKLYVDVSVNGEKVEVVLFV
jgi:hypothetical protein